MDFGVVVLRGRYFGVSNPFSFAFLASIKYIACLESSNSDSLGILGEEKMYFVEPDFKKVDNLNCSFFYVIQVRTVLFHSCSDSRVGAKFNKKTLKDVKNTNALLLFECNNFLMFPTKKKKYHHFLNELNSHFGLIDSGG